MTITQQSAQKALDEVPEHQGCSRATHRMRMEDWCETNKEIIITALPHFAQPSGEGVETGEWLLSDKLVYRLRHCGWKRGEEQFENDMTVLVSPGRPKDNGGDESAEELAARICRFLNNEPSPASPPDAVIAGAIEALDIAMAALWRVATTITRIVGGEVLDNAVSYLASKADAEIAIEKIMAVLPEANYNQLKALRTLPARQDEWRDIDTGAIAKGREALADIRASEADMETHYNMENLSADDFEAILSLAARSPSVEDKWRDISSAPRELYPWIMIARDNLVSMAYFDDGKWMIGPAPTDIFVDPTHWQPLPAPPSTPAAMDGEGGA